MMVWCIVGMALERKEPLHQIVNRLDIMLPGNRPLRCPQCRYSGPPAPGK
ncbi:putative transposase [Shigella flexneri 1485-80]|nr:putative transposase [Shigella flexneri 1485-80]